MAPKKKTGPQAILNRLQGAFNQFVQPLQTNVVKHVRNLRAEVHQRALGQPLKREEVGRDMTRVSTSSGGLNSYTYQEPEVNTRGRERTAHEIGFKRQDGGYGTYEARSDSRPQVAATRRAAIKAQLGRLMEEVKVGDRIHASSYAGDDKNQARSALYQRVTKGALTANDDDYMSASRLNNNNWASSTNPNGKGSRNIKNWNPANLGDDLKRLAAGEIVRRLATHPVAQTAVRADELIGGVTGTRPSEKVGQEFRNMTQQAILERLKKGQRFGSPIGPMPF